MKIHIFIETEKEHSKCSWRIYIQLRPADKSASAAFEDGNIYANALFYAPECGNVLTIDDAQPIAGLTYDKYWAKCRLFALFLSLSILVQTGLLIDQKNYTSSQSVIETCLACFLCIHRVFAVRPFDNCKITYRRPSHGFRG